MSSERVKGLVYPMAILNIGGSLYVVICSHCLREKKKITMYAHDSVIKGITHTMHQCIAPI